MRRFIGKHGFHIGLIVVIVGILIAMVCIEFGKAATVIDIGPNNLADTLIECNTEEVLLKGWIAKDKNEGGCPSGSYRTVEKTAPGDGYGIWITSGPRYEWHIKCYESKPECDTTIFRYIPEYDTAFIMGIKIFYELRVPVDSVQVKGWITDHPDCEDCPEGSIKRVEDRDRMMGWGNRYWVRCYIYMYTTLDTLENY